MRAYFFGFCLLSLFAGCSADWDQSSRHLARSAKGQAGHASAPTVPMPARQPRASFASLPDRGDLIAYAKTRQPTRTGAYTWHPVELSEEHALHAMAGGELVVTAPNGHPIRLKYVRHVEHPDGNWTWIGRVPGAKPGAEAILTFGEKAAFGSIPYGDEEPLRLTTAAGRAWLMETDRAAIARMDTAATRPRKPDFLLPPENRDAPLSSGTTLSGASQMTQAATATAARTVDVLLGYTSGFAARLGGQSQAVTRLTYLVDVTNQAYTNSQIDAQVQLVRTMQVDYSDATSNQSALYALTGVECTEQSNGSLKCTYVGPAAALQPLHAAREQYGADLVSLVRNFNKPENDGCGIAWLIGGGQSPIDASDADSGMSVVSDSNGGGFPDDGYVCRDETLAHELGHNMGSAHDSATADGDDNVLQSNEYGRYPYSFGYKAPSDAGNFYTVMAYGDSGQSKYRVFSNPSITYCGGYACGIANQSDNARSLTQVIPTVATFRSSGGQLAALDIVAIAKNTPEWTEVTALYREGNYGMRSAQRSTGLASTGTDGSWAFQLGDFNGDGKHDLYAIKKTGASGRTEVHVLNGADNFRTFVLHRATVLGPTGGDQRWLFRLGDYNKDGILDLYVIHRAGTDIHVLNGADWFGSFLSHLGTGLPATGTDYSWKFELGDYNKDGILDLYAISKMTGLNRTEVHVLSGASGFKTFLLRGETALPRSGSDNAWEFKLGDFNRDGILDIYVIQKTHPGNTAVHVMNGATNFGSYLASLVTAIPSTGVDNAWEFEIARP